VGKNLGESGSVGINGVRRVAVFRETPMKRPNWSVKTDALLRPLAALAGAMIAAYLQR